LEAGALREALRRESRARTLRALALAAPLALFLLLTFLVPIGALLVRAVDNPEVARALPRTVEALRGWRGEAAPPEPAFAALAGDLSAIDDQAEAGALARRLNSDASGARSLVMATWRALRAPASEGNAAVQAAPPAAGARAPLLAIDPRWGEPRFWEVIARNGARWTPDYLLAAVDLRRDAGGAIAAMPPEQTVFRAILWRTLGIAAAVTLGCLLLGYPLAWWLATLPARTASRVLILVLVPFWTSILVRVAGWIVLLQSGGLVNQGLLAAGLVEAPLALLFNRTGVIVAMVHILLPFMILPLYSVMRAVPPDYLRAAVSLGSHPLQAFRRTVVPLTWPGIGTGCLLVFILALGYYVTPALVGGPSDQMLSYSVAQYANVNLNWGMACALGTVLLAVTLVLYGLYRRLGRAELAP
jgi:putative spermidine/putrescine transport system permease protein